MSEKEKSAVQKIAEAVNILPESERGYIIGYAEGVIAASGGHKSPHDFSPAPDTGKDSS